MRLLHLHILQSTLRRADSSANAGLIARTDPMHRCRNGLFHRMETRCQAVPVAPCAGFTAYLLLPHRTSTQRRIQREDDHRDNDIFCVQEILSQNALLTKYSLAGLCLKYNAVTR